MKEIALIGGGGHAKVIIEIIEESGGSIGLINDTDKRVERILDYRVSDVFPDEATAVIISIGSNAVRKRISTTIKNPFATAVHPKANVSSRCSIGEGTVVMAGATINASVTIGKHCIVNTNASVDHDCLIGDFVHIAPGVSIAGSVTVGEGTLIGVGSSIVPGIRIGKWATIGAGTVVISDVPDHETMVGVPGKLINTPNNDKA